MKTSVIGLGVGYGLACSLASVGFETVGLDISETVLKSPRYDGTVAELLRNHKDEIEKNLRLTSDYTEVDGSDSAIIIVNTELSGETLNISHVISAVNSALARRGIGDIIVLSTLPFGASREIKKSIEHSGRKGGKNYVYSPLMISQGDLLPTFLQPPFLVFGCYDPETGIRVQDFYHDWLKKAGGKIPESHIIQPEEAELVKLIANGFASTKIAYANMCAELCEKMGVDGKRVMDVVGSHRHVGKGFFKPGYAFGGQCLPKDLTALIALSKRNRVGVPILEAVESSNHSRLLHPIREYPELKNEPTLILGLAYKTGIADTRSSPGLQLLEALRQFNPNVVGYDPNLSSFNEFPKDHPRIIVATTREPEFYKVLASNSNRNLVVLDYCHLVDPQQKPAGWKVFQAGKGWL